MNVQEFLDKHRKLITSGIYDAFIYDEYVGDLYVLAKEEKSKPSWVKFLNKWVGRIYILSDGQEFSDELRKLLDEERDEAVEEYKEFHKKLQKAVDSSIESKAKAKVEVEEDKWVCTSKLRYYKGEFPIATSLQQLWMHKDLGEEWRNVPVIQG